MSLTDLAIKCIFHANTPKNDIQVLLQGIELLQERIKFVEAQNVELHGALAKVLPELEAKKAAVEEAEKIRPMIEGTLHDFQVADVPQDA